MPSTRYDSPVDDSGIKPEGVNKRRTRAAATKKPATGGVKANSPKTPVRSSKRGRVSDPSDGHAKVSPSPSPSKKMKGLQLLSDDDDDDSEVDQSESTVTEGSVVQEQGTAGDLDDPFKEDGGAASSSKGKKSTVSDPDAERSNEVYLDDLRAVLRCTELPSSDGIPPQVKDTVLHKLHPRMPQPNLVLGYFVSWMSRVEDSPQKRRVALNYMAWYEDKFPGNTVLYRNIANGLSTPLSGRYYNAACADPRNFIAKQSAMQNGTRYELYSKGGAPVIGIMIGTCFRSELRDEPLRSPYRSITIRAHRGVWERLQSFHCMNFGLPMMTGQVVDGKIDFQTQNKPDSYSGRSNASKDDAPEGMESYETLTPSRQKKVFPRTIPSHRPYGFDEPVPILDGTSTVMDFTPNGLSNQVRTLNPWVGEVPMDSPCVVGYTIAAYLWDHEWRFKVYAQFVIVLADF
ncbi:hypothetical protein EST38_g9677 [Candolleomyces aberdarensis]|uniref:Uncharacterized protein n=1 Tax=Candolleomyces aberdarensis TaxID=2316362 RepID=A0A4Q2D9B2_9AGAR|nr:hypothetical protein EST38_g9677 [Candolleomyces aberdarensis]